MMNRVVYSTYFKPVENHNEEQQVKLLNPIGLLMEELPSSVITVANKDIARIFEERQFNKNKRTIS